MRYRELSPGYFDYTFGQGNANFLVNSPAMVGQEVRTRLLLLQGEWFLDVTEGTPYSTQILGKGTQATRDLAIKSRILKTPGVKSLISYVSDVIDRKFTVQARIDTIYGQTEVVTSL